MSLPLDQVRYIFNNEITAENINGPIDHLDATILHHLLRFPANTFEEVTKAIKLGADIDKKDINGQTPLFWFAAKLRRGYSTLQYDELLSSCDPKIQAKQEGTLLHVAAMNGIEYICTSLLTKHPDLILVKSDLKKQTALHVAKNAKVAKILINSMKIKEFTLDKYDHSELFYAVKERRDAELVLLIQNNFSTPPLDINDILSTTIALQDKGILPNLLLYKPKITQEIITKAVQTNNSQILSRILELDSSADVLTEISENVLSPYLASMTVNKWNSIYHMLIKKKCPDDWGLVVDDEGWNLAHYCISFKRNEFFRQLVGESQYSSLFKLKNKQGYYPLAYAVQHSTADKMSNVLQIIKKQIKEDDDYQKASDTFDLLHFAIDLQNFQVIEILVAMKFPFKTNVYGQSVFHKVCWSYPQPKVFDLLANSDKSQINDVDGTDADPDNERLTPLHYTLLKTNETLVACLTDKWNVNTDRVEIILKYLYKYEIDSEDVTELAELLGLQSSTIDTLLSVETSPVEVQPIQDAVRRLGSLFRDFAPPPSKDYPTNTVTVYKLYNIIIICNSAIDEPLITIDIKYVDMPEFVQENSYIIKFHIIPIERFDVEDAKRFASLPNKGVIIWFDVEMSKVLNSVIHSLDIHKYKLLIKDWDRDAAAAQKLTSDSLVYDNDQDTHDQIIDLALDMSNSTSEYISNQSAVELEDPRAHFTDLLLNDSKFHHRDLDIDDNLISSGIIFTSQSDTCYVSNFYACKNSINTSSIQPKDSNMLEKLNIVYTSYSNNGKLICLGNKINTHVIKARFTDQQVSNSLYVDVTKVMEDDNNNNNNNNADLSVSGYVLQSLYRKLCKDYCLLPLGSNELQLTPEVKIELKNVEHNLVQIRLASTETDEKKKSNVQSFHPYLKHLITTCITELGFVCKVKMFYVYQDFLKQIEIPLSEYWEHEPHKDPGKSHLTDLVLEGSFTKLYVFLNRNQGILDNLKRFMDMEVSEISKEGSCEHLLRLHIVKCNPYIRQLLGQLKCDESEKESLLYDLGIQKQYGRTGLSNVFQENKVEFLLCAVAIIIVVILVIVVEALNIDAGKYGIAAITSISFILLVIKRCFYSYKRQDRKYEPLTFEEA